jgi:hypothetical protein
MSDITPPTPPISDAPTDTIAPPLQPASDARRRMRSLIALLVMCAAVIAVYIPTREVAGDNTLRGDDFHMVHARRIAFARENLASRGTIPAWYPREAFGSPFWANVQNFPFIPTRLLLYLLPPQHMFLVGVLMAAVLSAVFTFLFARAIGLGPVAAAIAGWTFACAGFFASRILTGQLPLLEAYPSLPLLLWLIEINLQAASRDGDRNSAAAAADADDDDDDGVTAGRRQRLLIGLAAAAMCVALAGHPQLGIYAFIVAGIYLIWRGWGLWRGVLTTGFATVLGVVGAAFALWPALSLVGRSTRALPLARGETDVVYPYARLGAWLLPWKDGWPPDVLPLHGNPFHGFPRDSYFYDTVTYLGWLPLLAAVFLLVRLLVRRRLPSRVGAVLAVAGAIAMLTALPWAHRQDGVSSFTFLRSPSRQTYVTTFALAVALGLAADVVLRRFAAWARGGRASEGVAARVLALVAIVALAAFHAIDLARHDRRFLRTTFIPPDPHTTIEEQLKPIVGPYRTAIDVELAVPFNRRFDDIGFFDSIILARPYRTIMDLLNAPPTFNNQNQNGSGMSEDRLAEAGVRVMMTTQTRMRMRVLTQLGNVGEYGGATMYRVPSPVGRALFLPVSSVQNIADPEEMHRRRRARAFDPWAHVMLAPDAADAVTAAAAATSTPPTPPTSPTTTSATISATTTPVTMPSTTTQPAASPPARAAAAATGATRRALRGPTLPAELTSADYERPNSDEIVVRLHNKPAGVLRVMESFDPGWEVEVNNLPATTLLADDAFLAVALPPGDSIVRFTYRTPGAMAGRLISVVALAALFGLLWSLRPPTPEVVDEDGDDDEALESKPEEPEEPEPAEKPHD